MAYNFKSEEEVKEYLENIGTEYRFSCFSEKNAEGCHLLGDYLQAVKRDFTAATEVYRKNCDEYNYPKSCLDYGTACYLGKGTDKNVMKSYDYYKRACDLKVPEGCLYVGAMLTKEKDFEKNFVEGLKYLEKSCSLGNANGCFYASGLLLNGAEGVSVNKTKASELSLLACNGGNIFACMNLSLMYRRGDGVEKNEQKAKEFKERAKEIRDDWKKKPSIGLQQYTD